MKTIHTDKKYKTFKEVKTAYLETENPNTKKITYCKRCEAYHLSDRGRI